jgi:hypothetical protein
MPFLITFACREKIHERLHRERSAGILPASEEQDTCDSDGILFTATASETTAFAAILVGVWHAGRQLRGAPRLSPRLARPASLHNDFAKP